MHKRIINIFILSLLIVVAASAPAFAAKPRGSTSLSQQGLDVSWPQCGKTLPTGQAFAIVGVNGGLATTLNPCLVQQLQWAYTSTSAVPSQPDVQLYVNTANPGEIKDQVTTWPTSNIDPKSTVTSNPYGNCNGANDEACSWQYGWNRAVIQVQDFFIPQAQKAGVNATPSDYVWWLDVETENTWQSSANGGLSRNRATLEGMTEYFQSLGIKVGIYSTGYQWGVIVGTVSADSNLYDLNSWLAGARNLKDAQSKCKLAPLTAGGKVVLLQYVSNNLDYNHSCV